MPEIDVNVHPRSLAGAGTGGEVEPAELLRSGDMATLRQILLAQADQAA